jgi:RimJ/RimL family protein N-acetyltransferase
MSVLAQYPPKKLCWTRLTDAVSLCQWLNRLLLLMTPWLDDVLQTDSEPPLQDPDVLYGNLLEHLPHLWILYTHDGEVVAVASLSQVIPGQSALIHGIRSLKWRKHPALFQLAQHVLAEAFGSLKLKILYARFETDNRGALGFCRMHGFTRIAMLPRETPIQGCYKDVAIYALSDTTYIQNRR